MRKQFFSETDYTREDVDDIATWAAVVLQADGGWWAFESNDDAETWENQL